MKDAGDGPPNRSALEELTEVIDVAARLADSLGDDPLLQRLLEAFRLMPLEDRATVVEVIEREVQARRLSRATEEATGQSMHPNLHARLYLRSHEKAIPRNLLERDELMLAMLSAMRVAPLLLVPDIHAAWIDGTRAALRHLEPANRDVVVQLMREALALIAEIDRSDPPQSSGAGETGRGGP
jgi:hypothetical protein